MIEFDQNMSVEELSKVLFEMEGVHETFHNGYELITGKKTVADLVQEKFIVNFPFNPRKRETFLNVADLMIDYFERIEEYEKCTELLKVKTDIELFGK